MSLQLVIVLITIMLLLASTMVAVSTMNLNLVQGYFNGQVALDEAEAGVAQLLYHLAENPLFEGDIRGRRTPDYGDDDAWHAVTFRADAGLPWSVNNQDGTKPAGYMGRTVPTKMVHAFSTGYCRGQYRTIELVVEQPPFPYALACSGSIDSRTPLVVRATQSAAALLNGDDDGPGHVVSNASVVIGREDPLATYVSGHVRARGRITVAPPATVRGGLLPGSDLMDLPRVDVTRFNNQGQEGVVEISTTTLGAQVLDIMYHCADDLTYTGPITLENAFLYVQGNLVVEGGIKGTGAIVADSAITVKGDTALAGTNRVALLASGMVTLEGTGSYFQGMVYSGGKVTARNLTVVGHVIANGGGMDLEKMRVVSCAQDGSISFTATSSKDAQYQSQSGDVPFCISPSGYVGRPLGSEEGDPTGGGVWFTVDDPRIVYNALKEPEMLLSLQLANMDWVPPGGAALFDFTRKLMDFKEPYAELDARRMVLESEMAGLPNDDPSTPLVNEGQEKADKESELQGILTRQAELLEQYRQVAAKVADLYVDFYKRNAGKDGRYKKEGKDIDVTRTYTIDLNQFLPRSARLKVVFWHSHHRRL